MTAGTRHAGRRPGRGEAGSAVFVAVAGAVFAFLLLAATPLLAAAVLAAGEADVAPTGCGPGGTGQQIGDTELDADQLGNAATISTVTARRGLSSHAAVIAVATAYQESRLRNLDHGDRDSIGLFQQRVSIYRRAVAADPVKATNAFLDRLIDVPNWQTIPLTQAAQAVQRSAYPDRYATWQPLATRIVAQHWATAASGTTSAICPEPLGSTRAPGASGGTTSGTTRIPPTFTLLGSPRAQIAIRHALAQLGKPYQWGGAGPDTYDCSGLTSEAWAAAGLTIPRTSQEQWRQLKHIDIQDMRPGDLIIYNADASHVAMYLGNGSIVHAPRPNRKVTIAGAGTMQILGVVRPDA